MKELFEKQAEFNELVIENLCKRTEMDIKHSQFVNEDLLAVMVEVGEFIAEKDHELKKIEYADILISLMNCGLSLEISKCMTKKNILIVYAQATKNIYADAILTFNVVFSEFCNSVSSFKYWKKSKEIRNNAKIIYYDCFVALFGIAKMMGYSIEEIKESYEVKNKINYERQQRGY